MNILDQSEQLLSDLSTLQIIYAQEEFPAFVNKSIFLAGPTPRDDETPSWRPEAISYLRQHGYNGTIYIPEPRTKQRYKDYDKQFEWEHKALDRADIILFYIPRDLSPNINGHPKMAALTTNIEYGLYADSNRLVVCIPEDKINVSSNKYIQNCCFERQTPFYTSLDEALNKVVKTLGTGADRYNGECCVPLLIWENEQFQNWYQAQKLVGNELKYLKCNYTFVMPKARLLFLWICHVEVFIKAENRIKSNEFVLSRSDISSVVMYYPGKTLDDTYIVLVKEFRSPCDNNECMVYELPGGSSNSQKPPIEVAADEIKEETGIVIDKNRLQLIDTRQAAATLSAHKIHAYKVELTTDEFNMIKSMEGSIHGLEEDTERTYLVIKSLDEILSNNLLDWANIGMIMSA